jgi:cytochrome c biogenesis protein CcmG/thiol:disulfide interchange protein DsbE
MGKILPYTLPLALFLGLCGYLAVGLFRDPSMIPSALIDRPVPSTDLPPLEGRPAGTAPDDGLRRADLTGAVRLVNVWASWCVPCRAEHPFLADLKARHQVPIDGINYKDRTDNAVRFLAELGDVYERIGLDTDGRTSIDWGVYGVPETFLIDENGSIRHKIVGPLTPDIIRRELLPRIELLRRGGV